LKVYNTFSRSREKFKPINPPDVLMYNCGPTVYDYFHIGNARNFIFADTVRRYLEYRGYNVKFVQNLTDVDDKIIKRANEEGVTVKEIAEKYTKIFFEQCKILGIKPADIYPKATEAIPQMQEMILKLIKKGHAYQVDGDVYFSVRSYKDYCKLSGKNIDDLIEGARVDVNSRKKDPLDFALWKAAKPGEPSWESPWGKGRPGWHIECSAMATHFLGDSIDIHSGGVDLVFPHHENERAQSECSTGKPFVKYWLHNGFLNIDSQKMSKSLGNFFTIDQILEKYEPLYVKFFLLSAHYRHPLDLTSENLDSAKSAACRILDGLNTAEKIIKLENLKTGEKNASEKAKEKWIMFRRVFEDAMDDDFNTAKSLGVLHDIVSKIHEHIKAMRKMVPGSEERISSISAVEIFRSLLIELLEILGLDPDLGKDEKNTDDDFTDGLVQILISLRKKAREKKDFEIADEIRNSLDDLGVVLEDHPQGTIWKIKG
jgi:cysteinyl-tRNA synthetase